MSWWTEQIHAWGDPTRDHDDRNSGIALAGSGRANRNPCPLSHASLRSRSNWSGCSIPSASVSNPSALPAYCVRYGRRRLPAASTPLVAVGVGGRGDRLPLVVVLPAIAIELLAAAPLLTVGVARLRARALRRFSGTSAGLSLPVISYVVLAFAHP
jgi:hypothetical protein